MTDNPKRTRNFSTVDRILIYKRFSEFSSMYTFFATKKSGKSSLVDTCCQMSITDKGSIYVVPLKSKGQVPTVLNKFHKQIDALEAIICDASNEQTSKSLPKSYRYNGTTFRVMKEVTPWENKSELYIGLINDAVRKDMKESDCTIDFWC